MKWTRGGRGIAGAAGAVLLLAAGYGLAVYRMSRPTLAPVVEAKPESPSAPPEVSVGGTIRARQVIDVPSPVDGIIEAFFVETGAEVYEGEVLARIGGASLEMERQQAARTLENARDHVNTLESALIAARLEASRAQADATRARDEYDRLQREYLRQQMLYQEGATPKMMYEKVTREFEMAKKEYLALEEVAKRAEERASRAQSEFDLARQELLQLTDEIEQVEEHTAAGNLTSPAPGLVVTRRGQVGERVTPDMMVYQIATDLTALDVELDPNPNVLPHLHPGLPAMVFVAGAGEGLVGEVTVAEGAKAVVSFSNPNPAIRPGMTAQVRIKLDAVSP